MMQSLSWANAGIQLLPKAVRRNDLLGISVAWVNFLAENFR